MSIHDDRWLTYPWGVNGGLPGRRSTKIMVRTDGSEELMTSKCDRVKVKAGDMLHFDTWGGGGWGNPLARPAERVVADVERGLVTVEGARRYGVVVNEDGSLNADETESLRAQMAKENPVNGEIFNRGGTIAELKERCLEETGLEPPAKPEFQQFMRAS